MKMVLNLLLRRMISPHVEIPAYFGFNNQLVRTDTVLDNQAPEAK